MKNPILFKSTYSKVLGVLVVLGSTMIPLSSAQGAPTLSQLDRYPVGDASTEYGQPSPANPANQGTEQPRSQGAQGPIRSDDLSDTERPTATQASPEERSRIERSQRNTSKQWKGNQPSDYNWFKSN